MTSVRPIWGIHLEWNAAGQGGPADIAIGWDMLGDLTLLPATRDAFKAKYSSTYPEEKLAPAS